MNIDGGTIIFIAAMLFLMGISARDLYNEYRKKDKAASYDNIYTAWLRLLSIIILLFVGIII